MTASLSAANSNLPSPASDLSTLFSASSNKGFSAIEMVALSAAYTPTDELDSGSGTQLAGKLESISAMPPSALSLVLVCCVSTRSAAQSSAVAPPLSVTNPFGTLPAMPQMSIGRSGTAASIQYGIASLPVLVLRLWELIAAAYFSSLIKAVASFAGSR
ncbi:hypothetical protein U1Q18_036280, partial [Sarracenia purpurea var. burkii]